MLYAGVKERLIQSIADSIEIRSTHATVRIKDLEFMIVQYERLLARAVKAEMRLREIKKGPGDVKFITP